MTPCPPGDPAALTLAATFVVVLATVTVTDLRRQVIPNAVLLAGALVCVGIVAPTDPGSLPERVVAALAAGGFLMLGTIFDRTAMGMGDVKLAALLGLYLGPAVAPALLAAFTSGALVGLGLILRHGVAARRRSLAFGPFLAFGGIVGLCAGEEMIDWYLDGLLS